MKYQSPEDVPYNYTSPFSWNLISRFPRIKRIPFLLLTTRVKLFGKQRNISSIASFSIARQIICSLKKCGKDKFPMGNSRDMVPLDEEFYSLDHQII